PASAARARRRWTWRGQRQAASMDTGSTTCSHGIWQQASSLYARLAAWLQMCKEVAASLRPAASLLAILRFRGGFFLSFRQLGKLHKDEYGVSSARCCRFCLPRDFGKVAGASVMRLE